MSRTNTTIWRNDDRLVQDVTNGTGAMSITFDPEGSAYIEEFRLHLDSAATTAEDFIVSVDSNAGNTNDTNMLTQDMDAVKDVWCSDRFRLFEGDKVTFTYTNSDNRTYGLEIVYRRFNSQ